MAQGSNYLTTYYAKRIIGDAAAASSGNGLLQSGAIASDMWIFSQNNRISNIYGIKYVYDSTNGEDKVEFYGGESTATAWVQLDTGDAVFNKVTADLEGIADYARLLYPQSSGTVCDESSWSVIPAGGVKVWGESFSNPTLKYINDGVESTITDSGHIIMWLQPDNGTSNYAMLCMRIDGTFQSSKFIGPLNGNADSATKLNDAREIYVTLGTTRDSNNKITFDGTEDKAIHVSGILAITHGGTGVNTIEPHKILIGPSSGTTSNAPSWRVLDTLDLPIETMRVYNRTYVGTTPNYDNPGFNGFFEIRSDSEVTITGTRPFNSFAGILSMKTPDNIAIMQLAGSNAQGWWIRGKQSANVTLASVDWQRIVVNSGTWDININGTAVALTSNAGGTEQPIYFTGGKPAATSYALKATVNNGDANYVAYYSGARAISSSKAATTMIMPAHYYHNLYNNNPTTGTTVYVHYYNSGTTSTNTFANLRVKSGSSYKVLAFGGDGELTWNGTMTANSGYLKSTLNSNTVTIGSQNTSYCHIENSANIPFWFNKTVQVNGNLVLYQQNTSLEPGYLHLGGTPSATMTAASTNPRICFSEGASTQPVYLIYSDFDSYRAPAGLKIVGGTSATPAWFEVEGNIYNGGSIYTTKAGECGLEVNNTQATNPNQGAFIVGSSGNLGIYSRKHSKWVVACDASGNVSLNGNAATATKFNSTRTIKLTGSVTGSATTDGGSGWEIATTTNHNHDSSYVNITGDTMSGDLLFSNSGTTTRQVRGIVGDNDYWRIAGGATAANAGWMEIATADDGNEPVYVRQYTGAYTTIKRTLTLLDANGYMLLPSYINVPTSNNENPTVSQFIVTNGSDHYYRKASTAHVMAAIRSAASGSWGISVTGSSASCTGNAATATKLGTATVGGSNRPIYLNAGTATAVSWYYNSCSIGGGNTANYPWHRFATCTTGTGQYQDRSVIVIFHARYHGGRYGAIKLCVRTNSSGTAMNSSAVWLYRYGFAANDVKITTGGTTGTDTRFNAWVKCSTYPRMIAYILEGSNNGWSLISSNEPNDCTAASNGTEINASVSGADATDGSTVSYANSAGAVAWGNVTGKPSTFAPATHNHDSTYVNITGDTMTGSLKINANVMPSIRLTRTDSAEVSIYLENATAGWAMGIHSWGVGAGVFAIGQYSGTGSSNWRFKIDNNGYCFTRSYLNLGAGNEKNNSSPSYVAGFNSSDNYIRSYNTSYLSVGSLTGGLVTNTVTSHGNLAVTTAKGSYYGINLGHNASGMTIMSINASHQGLYNQTNGQWILYYNAASSSKSIVIGNSTVNITGGISLNLNTKITGSLEMTGNQTITGAGAHWTKWVNTTTGVSIEMWSDSTNQGIYTRGYWTGSAYTASAGWILYRGTDSYLHTQFRLYGAVWNDYAEFRKGDVTTPGRVVMEQHNGIMTLCNERLAAGAKIISDTYGFAIGETKECKTPIAVSGRVLVYPYRNRNEYELGAAVCSAPGGTIDIMTREEIKEYPERIIGTVSEIPEYEIWHCNGNAEQESTDEVKVDGRIWIYVR